METHTHIYIYIYSIYIKTHPLASFLRVASLFDQIKQFGQRSVTFPDTTEKHFFGLGPQPNLFTRLTGNRLGPPIPLRVSPNRDSPKRKLKETYIPYLLSLPAIGEEVGAVGLWARNYGRIQREFVFKPESVSPKTHPLASFLRVASLFDQIKQFGQRNVTFPDTTEKHFFGLGPQPNLFTRLTGNRLGPPIPLRVSPNRDSPKLRYTWFSL